jgi:hypothetical protein
MDGERAASLARSGRLFGLVDENDDLRDAGLDGLAPDFLFRQTGLAESGRCST